MCIPQLFKLKNLVWGAEGSTILCEFQRNLNSPVRILALAKKLSSYCFAEQSNRECQSRVDPSHLSNKHGGGAKVAKSVNVDVVILLLESSSFVFK